MLQLANTDLDFSQVKNLSALVELTPLNQEDISFMIIQDSMGTGTPDEISLATLLCFW